MATSWGQRKALGTRYSIDPALEMEKQRLQEEYNLVIPRAQIAEQKRQFNENMEMQKDARETAMFSDAVSGVGNMYLNNKYINAITPKPTPTPTPTPITTPTTAVSPALTGMATGAGTLGTTMGVAPGVAGLGAAQGSVGIGVDALSGMMGAATPAATTFGTEALTSSLAQATGTGAGTTMAGTGLLSSLAPYAGPAGLGFMAGSLAKSGVGKDVGKALLFGGGGEKEQSAVAGAVGGAAAGAAMGSVVPGVGTVVGGVVGLVTGAVSSLIDDSWICTACNRIFGMSKDEIDKMEELREYCEISHKKWLDSYIVNAPLVVKAIAEQEQDLLSFYARIHEILIEPIAKENDLEKCFEIYLNVVKSLFEKYTPEFEFKEAE